MRIRVVPLILGCALATVLVLDTAAVWARAGSGGSSGGSRGSRSYSTPTPPSSPSSPSRGTQPPASSPAPTAPPQRPRFFGGLMGGLAGVALRGRLRSTPFGRRVGGRLAGLRRLLVR